MSFDNEQDLTVQFNCKLVPWKSKNPLLTCKLAKFMFKIALKACKLRADIINAASLAGASVWLRR